MLEKLYDTEARALTRRLVNAYYEILLRHKDAFDYVAIEAMKALLERSAELERRIPKDLDGILREILRRLDEGKREPRPPVNLSGAHDPFVGREEELEQLLAQMSRAKGGVALIAGVRGMGGVGKTELALQAAHRLADLYPDRYPARLFLDAGERDAADMLAEIIRLYQPEAKPPDALDKPTSEARRLMSRHPGLLILDNVTRPDQARQVLDVVPGAGAW